MLILANSLGSYFLAARIHRGMPCTWDNEVLQEALLALGRMLETAL